MLKHLKFIIAIALSCSSNWLFAQDLKGLVKDVSSRLPISNAQIISSKATVLTNNEGKFRLKDLKLGDRIAIRIMGYETVELSINKLTDTLRIYLKQDAIILNEVMIKTHRNYKLDSLDLRKEYAKAFTFKGPSFTDMFITRDPNYDSPFGFTNPRSTASIASINLLQVFNLLGKKKAQSTRLKETLVRDEELNYVDQVFSKEKVRLLTGLDGDELIRFMDRYRPSTLVLKKMTGYELNLFIKKSFEEFRLER